MLNTSSQDNSPTTAMQRLIAVTAYFTPSKPEFTIVIFIHYKSRIAVAILHL